MAITLQKRQPVSDLYPGPAAFNLVKVFEGFEREAYPDPVSPCGIESKKNPEDRKPGWEKLSGDPWTIAYGHTGDDVYEGLTCTLAQAEAWLLEDMAHHAARVRACITVPLTQSEFDALVCIDFNLKGGVPKSMRACLNGGVTDKGVPMEPGSYGSALQQFPRNCRGGGIPIRGLLRRRLAEACIFSNLPWENACSENIVKLKLVPGPKREIDWNESTTLEDTLAFARQDLPASTPTLPPIGKPKSDPQWPRKPEPTITIIEDVQKPAEAALPADKTPAVDSPAANVEAAPVPLPPSPPERSAPSDDTGTTVHADSGAGAAGKSPSIEKSAAPTLPPVVAAPRPKNPLNSWTIWGGTALYFLPDLAPLAEKLLTLEIAGPIGQVLRGLAFTLLIFGRLAASLPLSMKARISTPTLRKP